MKKVLFVIANMEIGGTRTSLINLLNNLKNEKNLSIDVLVLSPRGELINQLPDNVNIKTSGMLLKAFFDDISVKRPMASLAHIVISILKKLLGYKLVFGFLYGNLANRIKKETVYDVIIGFQEGIADDAASFIQGKHHYSWVHSNIDVWFNENDYCESTFIKSDSIIFVANATKKKFLEKFPMFKDKCRVIKNTINSNEIKRKSKVKIGNIVNDDVIKFVSVGRVNPEKAFERIVKVSNKILKQKNIKYKWYIIGDGIEKYKIDMLISQYNLNDTVILLGAMANPYPIIAACDCLVLTSLSESQPMVMLESLVLGVPIITTKFASAVEIAQGAEHTYICDNSIEGIEKAIIDFVSKEELRLKMKKSAQCFEYDGSSVVEKIKELF